MAARFRAMLGSGDLDLPLPGSGCTAERHLSLFELSRREPVSLARLVEAHTDAVAILAEGGLEPVRGALYGVWASESPADRLDLDTASDTLTGTKGFCSGLGLVDRALVTADDGGERARLVDVDVAPGPGVVHDDSGWHTPALAAARTGRVTFAAQPAGALVGPPGWYLDRPGFWHGACGPAACWAGAAAGLADRAEELTDENPHRLAHLGGIRSLAWSLRALLADAGRQIDADPAGAEAARYRALALRHSVERLSSELLDRFGRAYGPRPTVADADVAQRVADTLLYLRQDHAERDLADLGGLARDTGQTSAR
jgi:hypothetical protein